MKKLLSILFAFILVLGMISGCTGQNGTNPENNTVTGGEEKPIDVDFSADDEEMFTDRDEKTDYDETKAITVKLDGTKASSDSDSVKISGSKVTLTEEGTYVISGELADGMLTVNVKDTEKLHLIFQGVDITSKTSAALYILEADKVVVTLKEGTENALSNGGTFTAIDDNNIDGALFSKQDLTINGSGSLSVTSPAGHGIVCKDDLVLTGGNYTVKSASHGLDANDSVRIKNANITIDAGKDAIHSDNSDDAAKGFIYISSGNVNGEAEGDGISAGAYVQISGGTIDLTVGGGAENGSKASSDNFGGFMSGGPGGGRPGMRQSSFQDSSSEESSTSMKGIKAANSLLISGGEIAINSADDAIHSDVSVMIQGGSFRLASGDDAIHAEDILSITGGSIDVSECYEGLEALHIKIADGDIKLKADDDGLNAAGGMDQSGTTGGRDGRFEEARPGGMGNPGGMSQNSNGSITISGGTLYVNASGDGIDANGTLEISGGNVTVLGPTQGDTATLDYDKTAVIKGGTFIGTGAAGMAQTFSDSEQGVIPISVGNQKAGTNITIKDQKGNTLLSYAPELSFAVVIFSDPALVSGESYFVTVGSDSGEFKAN